jgi:2-polyprenyl-6-methoxyphenol hydroxylase-like FAD-dependent oxidoreductase
VSAAPEVTVVGAGPVGMTLAALLGARGRTVRVLDRRAGPVNAPRAVHLDHQAARILDAAGVMADLAERAEVMDAYEWRSASGRVLLRIEPAGPLGPSGWPESLMFAQPDLEALLDRRLRRLGTVELHRGVEVGSLDQLGPGWVVGADGAGSTVRRLLGVGVEDAGYDHEWLVVDVVEAHPRSWRPCNVQLCDPARPTTAVSGGPGRRRFEFLRLPGEDPDELSGAAAAWRLLAPWGLDPGNARLERHALYRFGARRARAWVAGRVLLAGDAAHQMPPFAGQGLCAGLRDAANVACKLELILAGLAPEALAGTYETERAPQTVAETDFSVELGRVICVTDPDAAAARDRELAAAYEATGPIAPPPLPPLGPGLLAVGDPAAGSLSPQGVVEIAGRRGRLDDLAGWRWVLLGLDADPGADLDGGLARWFARLGGVSARCGPGEPYTGWFGGLGAAVALIRPDFAVYAACPDPAGAAGLLGALRAQLQSAGRPSGGS